MTWPLQAQRHLLLSDQKRSHMIQVALIDSGNTSTDGIEVMEISDNDFYEHGRHGANYFLPMKMTSIVIQNIRER